jgi:hypothetical protein
MKPNINRDYHHTLPNGEGRIHRDIVRRRMASGLRQYRKYAKKANLPPIRMEPGSDQYTIKGADGEIYLMPVFKTNPTIGTGRTLSMIWRSSVEFSHPASRWHPEEADEMEVHDGETLIETVFMTFALIALGNLTTAISEEELYLTHKEEIEMEEVFP